MLIRLDMASATPIYVQLRNQIVMGIGTGALKVGEKLPTVRQMAADAGVNTMTVNKTYQLLKAEGFIEIDRRRGAVVNPVEDTAGVFREKLEGELALLGAEAKIKGMNEQEFLQMCETIFDEADALFGKRTSTNTSNDRHANQEVAYLLQRIEDFPGMVILATNLRSNIDEAFFRRFQSVVYFPMPTEEQRAELWRNMLPGKWLIK